MRICQHMQNKLNCMEQQSPHLYSHLTLFLRFSSFLSLLPYGQDIIGFCIIPDPFRVPFLTCKSLLSNSTGMCDLESRKCFITSY